MNSQPVEKPIFEARLASWRSFKTGTLVLFSGVLTVWARKSWFRKPSLEAQFDTSLVDSFRVEGQLQEMLVLITPQGEERFEFTSPADARGLCNALRSLLGPLDEVSKSQMRHNEEERLERERRIEKAAKLEVYRAWFWNVADDCIALARGNHQIVSMLRTQDWQAARSEYSSMWQRAESLERTVGAILLPSLEEIGKACSDLDGPSAVRKCSAFLAALAATIMENVPPKSPLQEDEMRELIRPNWYHLRFLLLFFCLHREITLASEIGDWTSVEASLSKMRTLSGVLSCALLAPVGEHLSVLSDAAKKRDIRALRKGSDALDEFLIGCINERSYTEVH